MSKTLLFIGIASGLWIRMATGSEVDTNTLPGTPFNVTNIIHMTQTIMSDRFSDRWKQELVPAGARIVYDRFGPPATFIWIDARSHGGYGIHEYTASYGEKTVYKIIGAAGRESAVETLPLEAWGHTWEHWGGAFWTSIIRGSIGNTEEEDSPAVSASPSYRSLRHIVNFKWNEPDDAWNGSYGWRPWRDNPYTYLNSNFGHYQGRQFLRAEMRCYGYLRPNSFGIVKTEVNAIVTLSRKSQLVLGGYAYPLENERKYYPQGSLRIETYWSKNLISAGVASTVNGPFWNFTAEFKF